MTENVVTWAGSELTDSFVGAKYSIDTRQSTYGHETATYGSFFRDGRTSLAVSLDIVPRNPNLVGCSAWRLDAYFPTWSKVPRAF